MDSVEQTLQILSNATGTNTELLNIFFKASALCRKVSPGIGDIVVQLDVFNEQNEKPKTQRQSSTEIINLNSHQEVFQTIIQRVTKTSNEKTFLAILQHLLRIDPIGSLNDIMWKTVEKLAHRATQLENAEQAERLVNSTVTYKFSCKNCCAENVIENKTEMKTSLTNLSKTSNPTPPSPPPSDLNSSPPNAPAAPPIPPQPPVAPGLPPPPPPLLGMGPPLPPQNPLAQPNNILLPQQNAPRASRKLKTFNWTKIPPHKIMNKLNIWTIMANDRQYKCVELIDFKGIEGLFALQTTNKRNKDVDVVDGPTTLEKKVKEPKHIHLLNAQRSLKINIFLSQFKGFNSEDIVQLILTGDCKIMNLERLKDLKKFFESEDEILLLKNFSGDRQRLASAEKFLVSILEVSNFQLRIESMILKEEFQLNVTYLEPCLNDIIQAGNNLMKSKKLQEILSIIIIIGNFLNSGGYAGNAAGIKLSSLTKLTEIKANKTGMHLLHLIAMEVQKYNPELLDLNIESKFLENVSKINNDQIEKDIKDMDLTLDTIKKQIYSPTTDEDIKNQMYEFIEKAEVKIEILKSQVAELKSLRITMADFFCEDLTTFKVDECFEIFYKFCEQFRQAVKENDKREQQEIQASIRQKQKEEQLAQKALTASTPQAKSPAHFSPKRLCLRSSRGSIEGNSANLDINSKKNEDYLMAFLQNSNRKRCREKENIRKRRIDKRPDLLKFNFERERDQHSPNFVASGSVNVPAPITSISKTKSIEEKTKANLIQKSWKRLMEGYKASQPRDQILTPDISSKRERLQIFIRSHSTVDNIPGQPKKQASIKVIKTPLPTTSSVFNFSPKEIEESQAKVNSFITENFEDRNSSSLNANKPLRLQISKDKENSHGIDISTSCEQSTAEIKHSRVKLKTLASIVELGHRYSSISEEDLKTTIKKLRTPTLEKSQFCFSPTTLKSTNWNWDQKQPILNSVDEENSKLELNGNSKNNNQEQQQTKTEYLQVVKSNQKEIVEDNILQTTEPEKTKERDKVQESISRECCESALVNDEAKEKTNDQTKSKEKFSKRLVSKFQEKIRALSPLRTPKITEQQQMPSLNKDTDEPFIGSKNLSKIKTCSSDEETTNKNATSSKQPIEKQKPFHSKKSFVSRLQSKIRSLSPLKVEPEQAANFQSYVNFENDGKSRENIQLKTNSHQKTNIVKESTPKIQSSSKDNKNQLRLTRPNARISSCSTKINNSPKKLLNRMQIVTQSNKTPEKYQGTSTSKTVTSAASRNPLTICNNRQNNLNIGKTNQSITLSQDEKNRKKPHCQDWSGSNSLKKYNANLKSPEHNRRVNQTKSVAFSSNSSTKFEARQPNIKANTNCSKNNQRSTKFEARRLSLQPNANSSKNEQRRLSNFPSKNLPKRTASLSSKIVPTRSTITFGNRKPLENSTAKIIHLNKQVPNRNISNTSTSTIHTKSTKSTISRTDLRENLQKSLNQNIELSKTHGIAKSDVSRNSLQSNFDANSSQSIAYKSNIKTFSGLSSSGTNGKMLTFSEICQDKTGVFFNSNLDEMLYKANKSSSTSLCLKNPRNIVPNTGLTRVQPTPIPSHTTEQNFKRPCKKFK